MAFNLLSLFGYRVWDTWWNPSIQSESPFKKKKKLGDTGEREKEPPFQTSKLRNRKLRG